MRLFFVFSNNYIAQIMSVEGKYPTLIDLPVLLIFFARPGPLEKVFLQVKKARPSKIFLYQDGPRKNKPDDIININKCRQIVQNIDWECEVFTKFQESNVGCDPSEFIAQKWMFEHVDHGVILEDDDVPSQSFFKFCKELLERYKYDDRIGIICGMNNLGVIDSYPYSYLFTRSGSIWGWATWKRNVDLWDENYNFLDDPDAMKLLKGTMNDNQSYKTFIDNCKRHRASGRAHYESILAASIYLNSKLNIVPVMNMISNVGIGINGTHATDSIDKLPKGIRKVMFMKTYDMEFPLKHPNYIIEDKSFKRKVDRIMGNGYPLVKFYRKMESIFYRLIAGDFSSVVNGLRRKIGK